MVRVGSHTADMVLRAVYKFWKPHDSGTVRMAPVVKWWLFGVGIGGWWRFEQEERKIIKMLASQLIVAGLA